MPRHVHSLPLLRRSSPPPDPLSALPAAESPAPTAAGSGRFLAAAAAALRRPVEGDVFRPAEPPPAGGKVWVPTRRADWPDSGWTDWVEVDVDVAPAYDARRWR